MAEVGSLLEKLFIKYKDHIYLYTSTNGTINILNSDGSLNIKTRNLINEGSPFDGEEDGFYYYEGKLYLKSGYKILNLTEPNKTIPKKGIIMCEGDNYSSDYLPYSTRTNFNRVIYISKT